MKLTHEQGDPNDLQLLEVNARFMRHETFQALVRNIRRDGALSQWPLVYRDPDTGVRTVLSGNHRVKAAIAAGLPVIDWIESNERLTRDQQLSLQLSHNALVGEDDLAILKRLYQSIEDVDERVYAGLDDQTLDLMAQVDADSLAEANLDFVTVQIVFLPHEKDRAEAAFVEAKKLTAADWFWLARLDQHSKVLADIETAREAYKVGNMATALDIVLDVFERHVGDLREGFLDGDGEPARTGAAPVAAVLGSTTMPVDAAAVLNRAIERMVKAGDVPADNRWRALELLAADYLAGA